MANKLTLWLAYIIPPNGEARRVKGFNGKDFSYDNKGYKAPNINEFSRVWLGLLKRKVVYYVEGIPTPIPMTGVKRDPRSYSADDVQTVEGEFAVKVVRDALQDEKKLELLVWVSLIVSALSLVLCIVNAVLVYKLGKVFHGW